MTTIIRRRKLGLTSCKGIQAASTNGINLVRNDETLPPDDVYIRWGCTTTVPANKVINSAEAIHRVNNKAGFRQILMDDWNERNYSVPLCPYTWVNCYPSEEYHRNPEGYIVRPGMHAQGKHVYKCNFDELSPIIPRVYNLGKGFYVSNFIPKVAEYRVFISQGKVVWVAQKTPSNPNDVAWNVAKGGRFDNVRWGDWNLNVCRVALQAMDVSKLHFGGVDVMVDRYGRAYVIEINSAPSQTSPYRQQCVAKAFDWMLDNNNYKTNAFAFNDMRNWKDVIHPAVRGN